MTLAALSSSKGLLLPGAAVRSIDREVAPMFPVMLGHEAAQSSSKKEPVAVEMNDDSSAFFCSFVHDNPGRLQDHYRINWFWSRIGEGAFGLVRRGRSRRTQAVRAIKTIDLDVVTESDRKRLKTEIGVARQLDHPNVIRLYETFQEPSKVHLVMELCTGGELYDTVKEEERLREPQAVVYARQMLAAICYLHGRRIAHRDIKLENFLVQSLTQGAPIKMVDFGAARFFEPKGRMKTCIGTPAYVAPEVLKGWYDERCDMWSVGVCCYAMVSGGLPFCGRTPADIMARVKYGKVLYTGSVWKNLSTHAVDFVMSLLCRDFHRRPCAKKALESAWLADPRSRQQYRPKASLHP